MHALCLLYVIHNAAVYTVLSTKKTQYTIYAVYSILRILSKDSLAAPRVGKRPIIVCEKYWKHLKISN